ncbi:MAG TPA: hypothetical protein VE987_00450, partial [Polyangiaceae bacterium]|nr:hypothetical protein [Polyangiaceae bacterium]
VPMMRPMILEFPGDPTCRTLDRQYMFGAGLLVAPVFHESKAEYYLPDGDWVHLFTGEVRRGGKWYFDELDYFGMPLWIRPNAVIPMGADQTKVDYDYAAGIRLVCGKLDGSTPRSVDVVDRHGEPLTFFEVSQKGNRVVVTNLDGRADYHVCLPWATGVEELEGGGRLKSASTGVEIVATSARVSFVWRA